MQRRAQTILEQAAKLASALQRKDQKEAKSVAQSMGKAVDMLNKALDARMTDLQKQSRAIEAAMGARHYQRAASIAQTLAEAARVFEDPGVQAVRRLGLGAERLFACVEADDPLGARFLLSLALWSDRAFSPEEAAMAAKIGQVAAQLEAALGQRHQKSAQRLCRDLASPAGTFGQSAQRRAQRVMEPCLQLRQALEKGHRSTAFEKMTSHILDLRALGLPESRLMQALQDLVTLYDDLDDAPQRHKRIMALMQRTEELSVQAGERAMRLGSASDELLRLIQAENYAGALERLREVQENRALRAARVEVQESAPQGWQASLREKAPSQALKLLDTATSKAASLKETVPTKALSGFLDSASARLGRRKE